LKNIHQKHHKNVKSKKDLLIIKLRIGFMDTITFKTAFNYPFNRMKAMWNIFLIFLPIIGWFTLLGYLVKITKEFAKGKFKKAPKLEFGKDLKTGFFVFIKAIPLIIVCWILSAISVYSVILLILYYLIAIFVLPILFINLFVKETVASSFELSLVKVVFDNLGDYIIAFLKSILLSLIFLVMCIILIGFPAGAYTKNIFFGDFYFRRVSGVKKVLTAKPVAKKTPAKKTAKKATKKTAKKKAKK
jgi:hypothetical protein